MAPCQNQWPFDFKRKFNGNPNEDADDYMDTFEETMMDHGVVGDKAYTDRFQ